MSNANFDPNIPQSGAPQQPGPVQDDTMRAGSAQAGAAQNGASQSYQGSQQGFYGTQGAPQQPMMRQSRAQQGPNASERFFAWVRGSRICRGRDRWIGGVCDGLARRLGWNVALVRALMILSTFFFGAGAAFYGMAWFLLPDETDGRILSEELIRGNWDWNCLGVFLFMAVAICLPGAGWAAFAVSALVLWLILNRQTYMPTQQWNAYGPQNPYGMQNPYGLHGQPMPSANGYVPRSSAPWQNASQQGVPLRNMPQQGMRQGAQSWANMPSMGASAYRPQQAGPAQTVPQARSNMTPPAAFATGNVPPMYTAQPMNTMPAQPRYGRRKSGGPVAVLVTLGALLFSLALVMFFGIGGSATSVQGLQEFTLWSGGACVVLGSLIVVLGCVGRRAGGLHAIVWPMVCVAMLSSLGYVANSYYEYGNEPVISSHEQSYEHTSYDQVTERDMSTPNKRSDKSVSGDTSSSMKNADQQAHHDVDSTNN
jgi:phage shock protein PspC (stress-responsive transcriptional regulator)